MRLSKAYAIGFTLLIQRNQGTMLGTGITNPVYTISARMKMAPGARAWAKLRENAPMVRKTMDKASVVKNEKATKTKNASGVLLKFVMK
jgi:hypothetical protein